MFHPSASLYVLNELGFFCFVFFNPFSWPNATDAVYWALKPNYLPTALYVTDISYIDFRKWSFLSIRKFCPWITFIFVWCCCCFVSFVFVCLFVFLFCCCCCFNIVSNAVRLKQKFEWHESNWVQYTDVMPTKWRVSVTLKLSTQIVVCSNLPLELISRSSNS